MSAYPLLSLQIFSPDGVGIEVTDLTAVSVPLADGGWIGIKPGHTPLIAETVRGAIRFQTGEEEYSIEVHPGVLEIRGNTVIILTAGEISEQADFALETTHMEFDRLMQTLVGNLHPIKGPRMAQDHNG